VQRRRRHKAEPKNVFGSSTTPKSSKKVTVRSDARPIKVKHMPLPPQIPGAKPKPAPISKSLPQPEPEDDTASEPSVQDDHPLTEKPSTAIIEQQLLGEPKRQALGLSAPVPDSGSVEIEPSDPSEPSEPIKSTSERAKELIESSKARASAHVVMPVKTNISTATAITTPQIKPRRKFRSRISSYRPAARAKRLDRSRHMEYKYEMRLVLSKLGILEEHRSNLLATIWARGERLTTNESKEFLHEKLEEGIIDEEQQQTLIKIVDNYTVRR
jgi:hypothetical protein